MPYPTYSLDLTPSKLFLFPQMNKVLKRKGFADLEQVKHKMAVALKGIKISEFKNYFEQRKKFSVGVLHQMESTWLVNEV